MLLEQVQTHNHGETYRFVRVRSDGSPLDILTITTDTKDTILRMEIRENERGDCAFTREGKLEFCNGWESESQAQDASAWSKHFPLPATIGKQDERYAVEIFFDLAAKIKDTYLRHLLYHFPARASQLFFDKHLYENAQRISNYNAINLAQKQPIAAKDFTPQPQRKIFSEVFAANRSRVVILGIVLFAGTALFWYLFIRDRFGDAPAKWPQLSQDEIEIHHKMGHEDPELKKIAVRHRDFAAIANADVLPILKLIKRPFTAILADYKHIRGGISIRGVVPAPRILKSYDTFLDDIYSKNPTEQLKEYHNSIFLNTALAPIIKAELLSSLYRNNLTKILVTYLLDRIFLTCDYLERQIHRADLIDYLLRIVTAQPASEIAASANLILTDIIEIQERVVQILFWDSRNRDLCFTGKSPSNSVEKIVCHTIERYKAWAPSGADAAHASFQNLKLQLLRHGIKNNITLYRQNDMLFEKAASLLSTMESHAEFLEFRQAITAIQPDSPRGEFTHLPAYRRFLGSEEWRRISQSRILKMPTYESRMGELEMQMAFFRKEQEAATRELKQLGNMRKYLFGKEYEQRIIKLREREERLQSGSATHENRR